MNNKPAPIIVKKPLKHTFTPAEVAQLNVEFGQAFDAVCAAEADFDSVKAVHKAKITEAESRMTTLRATINAGFEMRVQEVHVVFFPEKKKKQYLSIPTEEGVVPMLLGEETMTPEDFEQDLIRAESIFERRVELPLWDANADHGRLIVGRSGNRWFSALRCNLGPQKLEERLDSEQMSFKHRIDAVRRAAKRCIDWLKEVTGPDNAKGFSDAINKVIEANLETVE